MAIRVKAMTPLLQVFDMQTSLDFYCNKLGFILVEKAGPPDDIGWVMLKLNDTRLMLNTQYEMPDRPGSPDPARKEAHTDACLYFMCDDADKVYDYVIQKGIEAAKPAIAPYGMKQLYITDPDGYNICFQSPIIIKNQN